MTALERPPPPIVGKVTHFSIELYWEEALTKANNTTKTKKGDGRVRVCVQEKDSHGAWGNVYTGYSKSNVMTGLEPWSQYTYRIRFEKNDDRTEWSPQIIVSTTKEPLTGEHLHKAIVLQDYSLLEKVLESGELHSVDTLDKHGFTPLMSVCQRSSLVGEDLRDFIESLVKHGADVNFQNEAGKTALMLACYAAKLEAIQELKYHGANFGLHDRGGSTALHWAMDSRNTEVIEYLLDNGADIESVDLNGWTPLLRCAAINGDKSCAATLLRYGTKVNTRDKNGKTALMIAVVNGHKDMVELLCDHNADLTVQNEFGTCAYEMAISMEKRAVIQVLEDHMTKNNIKFHH